MKKKKNNIIIFSTICDFVMKTEFLIETKN